MRTARLAGRPLPYAVGAGSGAVGHRTTNSRHTSTAGYRSLVSSVSFLLSHAWRTGRRVLAFFDDLVPFVLPSLATAFSTDRLRRKRSPPDRVALDHISGAWMLQIDARTSRDSEDDEHDCERDSAQPSCVHRLSLEEAKYRAAR
jgi:hypothetical protein